MGGGLNYVAALVTSIVVNVLQNALKFVTAM
jgi:hypothetical protein